MNIGLAFVAKNGWHGRSFGLGWAGN